MRKLKLIDLSLMLTTAFASFMALGYSFFDSIVHNKNKKREKRKLWNNLPKVKENSPRLKYPKEFEEGFNWISSIGKQDCYIKSMDNLKLHAYYLPAKSPKRYVILSHGYKGSSFTDFAAIIKFLHDNNTNLLLIDQRSCGLSQGKYISFGALEKFDLQRWAYYVDKRNKSNLPIYFYGQSLGSASALMSLELKLPKNLKGVISDCGYSSMKDQISEMGSTWFHLKHTKLLIFCIGLFCKILANFKMKDADTKKALETNKRPILYFHGSTDSFVRLKHSVHNYNITKAESELVIIKNAKHLCSSYQDPEKYRDKLMSFFYKYDNS